MAAEAAPSINTGNTEKMNNPVNKNRLIDMYQKLRLLQWPTIKDDLKSKQMNSKDTKALIQVPYQVLE